MELYTLGGSNEVEDRVDAFCVPGAGGGSMQFTELGRLCAPFLRTHVIAAARSPGPLDHEPVLKSARDLAEEAARALNGVAPRGFLLIGYSAGGLIAYELAALLGEPVRSLLLIDSYPRVTAPAAALRKEQAICGFIRALTNQIAQLQQADFSGLERLPVDSAAAKIAAIMKASGFWIPPREILSRIMHFWQHASLSIRERRPIATRDVHLLFARDRQRSVMHDEHLQQSQWELLLPGAATYHLSGDHFSILRPPHVTEVAAVIGRCLQTARPPA